MYICICNGVTDSQIKSCVNQGAKSLRDVNKRLCVGNQCGKCACVAKKVIASELSAARS